MQPTLAQFIADGYWPFATWFPFLYEKTQLFAIITRLLEVCLSLRNLRGYITFYLIVF